MVPYKNYIYLTYTNVKCSSSIVFNIVYIVEPNIDLSGRLLIRFRSKNIFCRSDAYTT